MIVMELARGGELSEYLEKTGKMTEEKAKGVGTHFFLGGGGKSQGFGDPQTAFFFLLGVVRGVGWKRANWLREGWVL